MPWNVDLLIRYSENLNRVNNLVRVYESHPDSKGKGRKDVQTTDVLRASVVLLHSTFEDMCRTIERELLPFASEEALNEIPLLGISKHGRTEKFFLGKLVSHRGKTVDEVIARSVEAHLDLVSYNSVDDFCAFLTRVGFRKGPFEPVLPRLASLMKRRHHIVHQADRSEKRGRGHQQAKSLSRDAVRGWMNCVHKVHGELNQQYCSKRR
jgi:hypothetical protein